jgi:hypothetical protein
MYFDQISSSVDLFMNDKTLLLSVFMNKEMKMKSTYTNMCYF